MDKKNFEPVFGYKSAMAQARVMLSQGLINTKEYGVIETKMCEIFGINSISLLRENDLINTLYSGNMLPGKEVL